MLSRPAEPSSHAPSTPRTHRIRLIAATMIVFALAACQGGADVRAHPTPSTLTEAEARRLSVTPFTSSGASCPAPPEGAKPPEAAPARPRCLWVVSADLDGNRKPDRLLIWKAKNQRSAAAYLDDGSVHPLEPPAPLRGGVRQWTQADEADTWDTATPIMLLGLGSVGRQQVLVAYSIGAIGEAAVVVALGSDRRLRLADDATGHLAELLPGSHESIGCATYRSEHLLVTTVDDRLQRADSSAGALALSYSFFKLTDEGHLALAGYQGMLQSSPAAEHPRFPDHCGPSTPRVDNLPPYATTPRAAAVGLVEATARRDRTRAMAFLGGAFSSVTEAGYEPDAWGYLTSQPPLDARSWTGRPALCQELDSTTNRCNITRSDGYTLLLKVSHIGHNWVVTGIQSG